ncbi:hypothetical protein [Kocuria sp. cx-455]|uniref:hypothetical protein n=1 Tax=Kocuria sp. cx-455 TaxID=2771377 RepID=UPI001CC253A4|nr:hypothetical protein [Kocuria sp. cx-455]
MHTIERNAHEGAQSPMSGSIKARRHAPMTMAAMAVAILALTACGAGGNGEAGAAPSSPSPSETASEAAAKEVSSLTPRAVVSYDGGLLTVDTESGEVIDDTKHEGFLRLNNAGDGRHVMVSDSDVFRVHDAGLDAQKHGDHYHYRESAPELTDVTFDAPHAGHVVVHNGRTTLFGDGDGSIKTFDSEALKDGTPEMTETATENPHHGVALELADGTLFTTQGTEDERNTVQALNEDGSVKAETTDCPGVHGEAAAEPGKTTDTVIVGCENGPVIYRNGEFHKVSVADDYSRSGNLAGSEESPIVLGDYKVDEDAEQERPTRVALFDTRDDSHQLVDLGSSYWFRSLARGPEGEALVLTYDGKLNVIDEKTGTVAQKIDVIEPWEEKEDWQEAGPAVRVAGSNAYVTDVEDKKLHVVDLSEGKVAKSIDLPETPVEMAVVTGKPEAPVVRVSLGGSKMNGDHLE